MQKILLRNARVDGEAGLKHILINGALIESISDERSDLRDGEGHCYNLEGRLVVPGFVNIHTHLDKAGLAERITNESGSVGEARAKLLDYKKNLTKEDIKERAKRTIRDAVRNGCVAIRTHVDVDPIVGLKGIEALLELKEEMRDQITLQIVAFPQEGISEAPGTYELMCRAMELGADVVGGHLSIAKDFYEHSARVYEIAQTYHRDIDIHVDYDIDRDYSITTVHADGKEYPSALGITAMCEDRVKREFRGTVVASHLCGLDSIESSLAENIIGLIKTAGVSVVALPPNNMYCNGRGDAFNVRRGVTKVKALLRAGVRVSFGPDNIKDPFNPLGSTDMIQNAILTAYACHMASEADYSKLFAMCTHEAAAIMGLENYGLKAGCMANIAVIDAVSCQEALANGAAVISLFRNGEKVF